jgi:homoserine dehydrogenase
MRIILVGFGNVGRAPLHMIAEEATALSERFWLGLRVVTVLDRRGGASNQNGLNIAKLLETDLREGTVAATPKIG